MKRLSLFFLTSLLCLSACSTGTPAKTANSCEKMLVANEDFFLECVSEMEKFGEERIYVAMEAPEAKEGEEAKPPRLVSYIKESDDREEIENEILEKALTEYGFRLIFFQTAGNSRQSVIFSYSKETDSGVQNGIYYTYDTLPCAWWGRKGDLVKKHGRWLQIGRTGNAAYYTLPLTEHFYYFEKYGNLIA